MLYASDQRLQQPVEELYNRREWDCRPTLECVTCSSSKLPKESVSCSDAKVPVEVRLAWKACLLLLQESYLMLTPWQTVLDPAPIRLPIKQAPEGHFSCSKRGSEDLSDFSLVSIIRSSGNQ